VLFTKTAKLKIWLLRMNKLKTKYKNLAQCKSESLSLSTALLTVIANIKLNYETYRKNA
jgi:hypothetical protein